MFLSTSEEIISRFVGLKLIPLVEQWRDVDYGGATAPFPKLQLDPIGTLGDVRVDGFLYTRLMPGQIEMENDVFRLRDAFTRPVQGPDPINVSVPEISFLDRPDYGVTESTPSLSFSVESSGSFSVEWSYEISYEPGWIGSILSVYHQVHFLDDRDTLTMGDGPDAEFVESIAQTFREMVTLAPTLAPAPKLPDTVADMRDTLTVSSQGAGHDPLASEHDGVYVNGRLLAEGEKAPDIFAMTKALQEVPESEDGTATLTTGGNTVVNEGVLTNFSTLAPVSVVTGDWHETNSISQFIVRTGTQTDAAGMTASVDNAYNIATFERIDLFPGPAPVSADFPFPVNYTINVIHADLKVVNYMAQMQVVLDGDSVVLTAVHHEAIFEAGGNLGVNSFDITDLYGMYDIVIIGGSVFEGNFLRQVVVLSDDDTIDNQAGVAGMSGTAGGNLVANYGAIVNYGSVDFSRMGDDIRDLVGRMMNGQPAGDGPGAELSFLAHSNLEVLYLDGDVYEMNIVDQVSILDDSDTIRVMADVADTLSHDVGLPLHWEVSTGANAAINAATILDIDDVSLIRYLDGEYYSQSMLIQADIIADDPEGIQTFDTHTLAPEVIAFTTSADEDDAEGLASGRYIPGADFAAGYHDGLGGITA